LANHEPEWCDDVSKLPEDKYHRKQLAKDTGIKACVGIPFPLPKPTGIMEFFLTKASPVNKMTLKGLLNYSKILGKLKSICEYHNFALGNYYHWDGSELSCKN
jgi:hypothetical protein